MTSGPISFRVDGEPRRYSLAEMFLANAEDDYVCDWLRDARPGDVLREIVEVECLGEPADVLTAPTLAPEAALPPAPPEAIEAVFEYEDGYLVLLDDLARAWEGVSYTRATELVPSIYGLCVSEAS